jgi:hypothetical protein
VDDLRRDRAGEDPLDPAKATAADCDERVLLALDLADQLVPREAADDFPAGDAYGATTSRAARSAFSACARWTSSSK